MTESKTYSLGMTEVEARQVAEIRGKMALARQFPRDPEASLAVILRDCSNIKLAETAVYSYPRGDTEVKGASIKLAEAIAARWGNIAFSLIPSYVVEAAVRKCEESLEANLSPVSIEETREAVAMEFQKLDSSITKEALGRKIGKAFDKINTKDIVKLKYLYSAVNEGFVTVAAAFGVEAADGGRAEA